MDLVFSQSSIYLVGSEAIFISSLVALVLVGLVTQLVQLEADVKSSQNGVPNFPDL